LLPVQAVGNAPLLDTANVASGATVTE
jgi:hypothetical protein